VCGWFLLKNNGMKRKEREVYEMKLLHGIEE